MKDRYNQERKYISELMKRDVNRDKLLADLYKNSHERITRQINDFYLKYANENGLTRSEAKKLISQLDVTQFNFAASQAVKDRDFSDDTNKWLKAFNLKIKVSRLELLKQQLSLELQLMTAEANDIFNEARHEELKIQYQRQSGILADSVGDLPKNIRKILEADFYGQTFSSRVWGRTGIQKSLQKDIFVSLNRIFTDLNGYKQEMKQLARKFNTSENEAKRLLKTEIARINSDTQLETLKQNEFTHLIFVAEPGACPICSKLDEKKIEIAKAEKGVNMYPMHPNCRCSAYGYIEKEKDKLDFTKSSNFEKFESDIKTVWEDISQKKYTVSELTTKLDYLYHIGELSETYTINQFKSKVYVTGYDLAKTLHKHGGEYNISEMMLIKDVINNPTIVANNRKHHRDSLLLYGNIPDRKKSVMEAVLLPKREGGYIIHYHKIGIRKINKLKKEGKIIYENERI